MLLFFLLALAAVPSRTVAAPDPRTLAIYIEGPDPGVVRAALLAALSDRVRVIDPANFRSALLREGLRSPVGASSLKGKKRQAIVSTFRNAATASGAEGVVVGVSSKRGVALMVALLWIDPKSPTPLVSGVVRLKRESQADGVVMVAFLEKQIETLAGPLVTSAPTADNPPAATISKIEPKNTHPTEAPQTPAFLPSATSAPQQGVATPVATPQPAAPANPRQTSSPTPSFLRADDQRRRHQANTALVVADLAFEIGGRQFGYSDPITGNLPNYGVFGVPMLSVGAEVYPAALTSIQGVRDLGLTVHVSQAFGLGSVTSDGTMVDTAFTRVGGGLRFRHEPAFLRGALLGVSLGMELDRFSFDASPDLARVVASVKYLTIRVGLDARIPFWRLALLIKGGYDAPVSAGDVSDRFRGSSVGGIDVGVGMAFALGAGFEVGVRGTYTRYFYRFDPVPGDAYVAGGALDEFVTFGGGVGYVF